MLRLWNPVGAGVAVLVDVGELEEVGVGVLVPYQKLMAVGRTKHCALPMAALTAGWPYQAFATLVADAWNCVGTEGFQKPAETMFDSSDDDMAGSVS